MEFNIKNLFDENYYSLNIDYDLNTIKEIMILFYQNKLDGMGIEFDSFAWNLSELFGIILGMLAKYNIINNSESLVQILKFLIKIKSTYNEVPYHTFRHAMDVCYVIYYMLTDLQIYKYLMFSRLEAAGLIISALGHDMYHPGYNNLFQINAGTEIAKRYNGKSVLEKYSADALIELMNDTNIIEYINVKSYENEILPKELLDEIKSLDNEKQNEKKNIKSSENKLGEKENNSNLSIQDKEVLKWEKVKEYLNDMVNEFILNTDMSTHFHLQDLLSNIIPTLYSNVLNSAHCQNNSLSINISQDPSVTNTCDNSNNNINGNTLDSNYILFDNEYDSYNKEFEIEKRNSRSRSRLTLNSDLYSNINYDLYNGSYDNIYTESKEKIKNENENNQNGSNLNESCLNEYSINESNPNESSLNEYSINESNLNERKLNEYCIKESNLNEYSLNDSNLNEYSLNESILNEFNEYENSKNESSQKENNQNEDNQNESSKNKKNISDSKINNSNQNENNKNESSQNENNKNNQNKKKENIESNDESIGKQNVIEDKAFEYCVESLRDYNSSIDNIEYQKSLSNFQGSVDQTEEICSSQTKLKSDIEIYQLEYCMNQLKQRHYNLLSNQQRRTILNGLLHAADISNAARPWYVCEAWSNRVVEEFWKQGDEEKRLNLPVSPNMDRDRFERNGISIVFNDIITTPFYEVLFELMPSFELFVKLLRVNRSKWNELIVMSKTKNSESSIIDTFEPDTVDNSNISLSGSIKEIKQINQDHQSDTSGNAGRRLSIAAGTIIIPETILSKITKRNEYSRSLSVQSEHYPKYIPMLNISRVSSSFIALNSVDVHNNEYCRYQIKESQVEPQEKNLVTQSTQIKNVNIGEEYQDQLNSPKYRSRRCQSVDTSYIRHNNESNQ